MSLPDLSAYRQTTSGYYFKNSDGSGPYSWDGSNMNLIEENDTILNASATFTRPNDATPYTTGDLVANSTVAGSVAPMQFAITTDNGGSAAIVKARLRKSGTSVANAFFSLHLWTTSPTPSNGDNGAFLTDKSATYLGRIDFGQMLTFTDGAAANGTPAVGYKIAVALSSGMIVYGLLEARGAYTPAAQEVFQVILESDEE